MKRVLIIGAYGNFGSYIAKSLVKEPNLQIIVAGRTENKCKAFAKELGDIEWNVLDIHKEFEKALNKINPDIVIHTSGPFQGQNYNVAESCIANGCHYIDLADGLDFVSKIETLNDKAKSANVTVISGASSVPCLSSAIIDKYKNQFEKLNSIDYGIATAQQTNRGLATTSAILSYTGKPFKTLINGKMQNIYGWQDFHFKKYPELGYRALGNCEIPDLTLFPKRYPELKTIRFYAGTEILFMHIGLWLMSWLVRFKLISSLEPIKSILLKIANMFDCLGSSNSAFHMTLNGIDKNSKPISKTFYLLAKDGDGPYIPCAPAIILTKQLANKEFNKSGAFSSMGLITFEQYFEELKDLNIKWIIEE